MDEKGSQGSSDHLNPHSDAPDADESQPHRPDSRADVGQRPVVARPRKFKDGKKLWKQNAQGIHEYEVSIVSARYDDVRHSWMYTLKDWKNEQVEGETEETKLS